MAKTGWMVLCIVLALAVAASAGEAGIASQTENEVKDFLARQIQAFAKKDLNALMSMLAPDASVVMLGNGPDERWVGPAEIKKAYENQMAQYKSETIKLVRTSIGAEQNIAWFATQALVDEVKEPTGKATLRINWSGVLQKRDGKWLLVQSHFSFPAQRRNHGHYATTSNWRVSMVKGNPISARTSRHRPIASLAFSRACSFVLPWLTHPGMDGHSTIQTPSSSRSMVTRNFISTLVGRPLCMANCVPLRDLHIADGVSTVGAKGIVPQNSSHDHPLPIHRVVSIFMYSARYELTDV